MKIKINGKDQVFEAHSLTIVELLQAARVENPEMVSVQLNGEFVGKEKLKVVSLKDKDEVDFLYFMGGGGEGDAASERGVS